MQKEKNESEEIGQTGDSNIEKSSVENDILSSLDQEQITVSNKISRDGMRRTPYRLSETVAAGHKIRLIKFDRGETRLMVDGKEFDSPEIIDRINTMSGVIVTQKWAEFDEKEKANKQLIDDISSGLEDATISKRQATEMRGSTRVKLTIYEGEINGHKIKLVGNAILRIDDKYMSYSPELDHLIKGIQDKAEAEASMAKIRKEIDSEEA